MVSFRAFLEKNLKRRLTVDQVNEIIGENSLPETEACVAPYLGKQILNYVPNNRRKGVENRDKDLSLIQRALLNSAAPLCCLHDRLERKEDVSNEEVLTTLQQSLCLLGSANHITTITRRKKILGAINPGKIQLADNEFPNAGKMLFGEDLPPLAAKHSELSRSLSKNLQKPQYITQHSTQTPKQMQNTPHRYSYTQAQAKRPFRGPSGQKGPEQKIRIFENSGTSGATAGPASKQSCSKTTLVPFAMAKDHKRPGCYRYSSRVQNRFSHNTLAKTCSKDDSCWEECTLNATRDNQTRRKGGYNPRTSHAHGVLQSSISSTKEKRLISPSHRLKSLEQIHSERTFPNGKLNVHKAPLKRKRIYGQTRPKRRLPNGGRPSRVTEVPSVHLARLNLPVSSLTVRTKHGTTNIYETAKASGSLSSHSKYQTSHLPGRHINYRVVSTITKGTHSAGNRATSKPRLYHQLREVAVDPYSSTRVPRVLDKLENNEILPTSDKGSQSARSVQISPEGESNLTTPSRSASGFPRVLSIRSVVSPLALQASTELFNPTSSVEQGVVSGHVNGSPIHPPATEMVITSDASKMGWGATFGNLSTNGRWSKQESDLHINVLELKATFFSNTSFSEKSVESSGETPYRQHNSSDVCQQPRRYSITQSHVIDTRTVELVPTTQHSDHCTIPPGCLQCPGRQRVANIYRFQRLETTTRNNTIFPQGQRDRSLRHKTDQSIKELCELATRPTCCGDGRFFNRLESDERICVPTIQSHPTDINEGDKRQCEHSASSTSVANSTLVATTATAHSPTSSTSPRIPNSSTRPVQSQGNPSNVPETATSRLDYFQQLCTTAGLSNTCSYPPFVLGYTSIHQQII